MTKSVGERLRELRGKRSQAELAEISGISRSYINSVERGVQEPSRKFLQALRERLGVNGDWLLYGAGEPLVPLSERSPLERTHALERMMGERLTRPKSPKNYPTMVLHSKEHVAEEPTTWVAGRPGGKLSLQSNNTFGYRDLKAPDQVRLKALTDDTIAGTNLFHLVRDEKLWQRMKGIHGWEFELLRDYVSKAGDKSLTVLTHLLHYTRMEVEAR